MSQYITNECTLSKFPGGRQALHSEVEELALQAQHTLEEVAGHVCGQCSSVCDVCLLLLLLLLLSS